MLNIVGYTSSNSSHPCNLVPGGCIAVAYSSQAMPQLGGFFFLQAYSSQIMHLNSSLRKELVHSQPSLHCPDRYARSVLPSLLDTTKSVIIVINITHHKIYWIDTDLDRQIVPLFRTIENYVLNITCTWESSPIYCVRALQKGHYRKHFLVEFTQEVVFSTQRIRSPCAARTHKL